MDEIHDSNINPDRNFDKLPTEFYKTTDDIRNILKGIRWFIYETLQ